MNVRCVYVCVCLCVCVCETFMLASGSHDTDLLYKHRTVYYLIMCILVGFLCQGTAVDGLSIGADYSASIQPVFIHS